MASTNTKTAFDTARRRDRRRSVLLTAVVVSRDGKEVRDCTMLDVSDTGARLRLSRPGAVPPGSMLIDLRNRKAYELLVAWQNQSQCGVRFVKSHLIDANLPKDLAYLSHVWLAYATR